MSNWKAEYHRLRTAGWRALDAIRTAKLRARFDAREDVRLRVVEDSEPYDVSYVDTWDDLTERQREHIKTRITERAWHEGCCGIVTERRCSTCGNWEQVDSCWGFIGDDWRDSGYDDDMRLAALEAVAA